MCDLPITFGRCDDGDRHALKRLLRASIAPAKLDEPGEVALDQSRSGPG